MRTVRPEAVAVGLRRFPIQDAADFAHIVRLAAVRAERIDSSKLSELDSSHGHDAGESQSHRFGMHSRSRWGSRRLRARTS
jgi:hypothetical protein